MMRQQVQARYRGVVDALYFSLLESASLYPVAVLLAVYALPLHPLLIWLLAGAVHAAGVLAGREQSRRGGGRLGTPILLAAAVLLPLAVFGLRLAAAVAALALLAAAIRGLIAGRKQWWKTAVQRLPLIGLGASLVLYITAGQVSALHPHRTSMYVMAMITLFALLLRMNGERVRDASHAEQADRQLFGRILTANRSMTWIVIVLIALLSGWKGLGAIFLLLRDGIRSLLQGLGGDGQPAEQPPQAPAEPMTPDLAGLDQGPVQHPMWLKITGYVILGILCLIALILLGMLLYKLFRRWLPERIRNWVRHLAYRLGLLRQIRRISEETADFVDEVERIDRVSAKPRRFRRFRKEQDISGSDPRQAYESLIRRAVKKGFAFRASRTPAENGAELSGGEGLTGLTPEAVHTLIDRYNAVRYGGKRDQ
ncbi:DUF4129 domain-containing protein [Paenibacillus sp. XY044]|uniref:DUF4129 domain-containing protein n=1 Tax=Paenibacillus sp. XY044 TaxID=2026089 RepID=UPI000B999810|nr:DUF4129 domain-containing protein [Paenibacillus sp. XY044]OZB93555.1 hypothetical protein CJP46_21395 [Paenibacillus sp. XY044]